MASLQLTELVYSSDASELTGLAAVPAIQRRRLSALSKLALNAAVLARGEQPVDYIVWSSLYGDEEKTSQILSDVARGESPSPTQFSMSVNNAIAGLYSILFADNTQATSLSGGWSHALLEALAFLRLRPADSRALVVAYDEPLPSMYSDSYHFERYALAAVLTLNVAQAQTLTLQLDQIGTQQPSAIEAQQFFSAWQAGGRAWPCR